MILGARQHFVCVRLGAPYKGDMPLGLTNKNKHDASSGAERRRRTDDSGALYVQPCHRVRTLKREAPALHIFQQTRLVALPAHGIT